MRKLIVFNNVTLDGYFAGKDGDISWFKGNMDPEFTAFVLENAIAGGTLAFGRVTYEMMASYWQTPEASENDPVIAERMNNLPKVVFSKTLDRARWNNTTLVKTDLAEEVRKLKKHPGKDIAILGSGQIVAQLAQAGLIDEYQIVLNPVIVGQGKTMFEGIAKNLALKLTKTRTFGNGNIVLWYVPRN
jgi:dihydrofolate reductase